MKDYARYDGVGLAELVRRREVHPAELLEAAIARADVTEPVLAAIHQRLDAMGRAMARGPLIGAFAGVPFLVKDIAQDIAGVPTGAGNRFLITQPVAEDSEYVRRLRRAGLVIFGKTATPEFALKGYTEPEGFAPTRNPIDPEHTPGGSSGGAAAVVAAGVVPMAGASDGGGSIRIPASYTGLFGLRPSRGRVPCGPAFGEFWEGASSEHVLTRSVRDSAAMLDVLAGPLAGDPFRIAPPAMPFAELARREPGRLRIGYSLRSPVGLDVHPDVVRVVRDTALRLERLGHHVEEAEPAVDGLALAKSFLMLYCGQTAANVAAAEARGAQDDDFEPDSRVLALLGSTLGAGDYVREHWRWNEYARALGQFFSRHDLYLTPATAFPAPRIGALRTPGWQRRLLGPILHFGWGELLTRTGAVEQMARENLRYTPFTQLSNLTGTPSMSVPMGLSSAGLPIGAQFVAPHGEEGRLLALATQLEPEFQRGQCVV